MATIVDSVDSCMEFDPTNVPMETGQAQTEFNDAFDDAAL